MKLEGCVAVVIGGACGMGWKYCDCLLQNGVKVSIGDILVSEGEKAATELGSTYGKENVYFTKCNGVSEADIRAILLEAKSRWGRLDIVVNHVGIADEKNWKRMLEINVGSAFLTAEITEEIMGKNNGGSGGVLVHTASRAGIVPSHLVPRYSATKAAMVQYTRALMHPAQYKRHGIRMFCICPSITKTNFIFQEREKVGVMYDTMLAALKYKEDTDTFIKIEWVGELLIDMLRRDEEMAGVAAELNSSTPVFHYKGEWRNV